MRKISSLMLILFFSMYTAIVLPGCVFQTNQSVTNTEQTIQKPTAKKVYEDAFIWYKNTDETLTVLTDCVTKLLEKDTITIAQAEIYLNKANEIKTYMYKFKISLISYSKLVDNHLNNESNLSKIYNDIINIKELTNSFNLNISELTNTNVKSVSVFPSVIEFLK